MKIKVLTPGLLATVQDLGRPEWRASGVPVGGAADTLSHRLANFLLANEESAATLEIAGGGFSARMEAAGQLAVCGAGGRLFIDKKEIGNGRLAFAPEGAELEIRANGEGNFAYLATRGGWDVPKVLGSRSTCLSADFGGFEGRALRKGDVLCAAYSSDELRFEKTWVGKWFVVESIFENNENVIRVLPGPEFHWWNESRQKQFFDTPFVVSKQRDRMGARLETSSFSLLSREGASEMLSTAVASGTVQVPPDGQPIVLLSDAQTTGGYPRIAQIAAVDIGRLAQTPPGQAIRFQQITLEEAERLFYEQENLLRKIRLSLHYRWH